MFQDLSALVEEQGTSIDTIEANIASANSYTTAASHQLQQASKLQSKFKLPSLFSVSESKFQKVNKKSFSFVFIIRNVHWKVSFQNQEILST
jgi:t-SNARE complex subunit (syntaxin)